MTGEWGIALEKQSTHTLSGTATKSSGAWPLHIGLMYGIREHGDRKSIEKDLGDAEL
jgi:hypothetical protein